MLEIRGSKLGSLFKDRKGLVLLYTLVFLVGLSGLALALLIMFSGEIRSTGAGLYNMKALYIAEAGRAKARWALTTGTQAVGWAETAAPFGTNIGTYVVTTAYSDSPANQHVIITSDGYVPNNTTYLARRRVVENDVALGASSANLSIGATAFASSESGGGPAGDAVDGNIHSKWMANDKGNAWLKLDFGSPVALSAVVVNGQSDIDSVSIQYSSDDKDYSSVTGLAESPQWTFNFNPVTARYIIFNMGVDSNKKASVNELETYSVSPLGQGKFATSL